MNKVVLLGRLGDDAKVSIFDNGSKVTKFSLATTEKYKTKEETSWHNVDVWGEYGVKLSEYLTKGKQVLVEGRIQYSKSKKGDVDTYFTSIVADNLELLGGASGKKDLPDVQVEPGVKPAAKEKTAPSFTPNDTADDLPF